MVLSIVAGKSSAPARADDFPTASVKVISDSSPGSAPDVILRIVGDELSQVWGQQLVVMNQPGAGGSRAARSAASATPDGYTLLMAVSSAFVTVKGSAPGIPIELPGDLSPISLIGEQPMFVVASPGIGVKSVADLIALAKSKPGEVSYAVAGRGRQSHLTGEMLQRLTGIKLLMVPYSSGGPAQAIGDLAAGRVHILIEGGTALLGSMQAGMVTAIGVGAQSRLAEFPELSAIAETVPGFKSAGWLALLAPTATPDAIVRQVNRQVRAVLTKPEVIKRLAELGSYARPLSPEDTVAYIKSEQQTWGPILDELAPSR